MEIIGKVKNSMKSDKITSKTGENGTDDSKITAIKARAIERDCGS